MTRRIWDTALFLLLSICTANSFAQNATTSLRGVVKDPTGAVVPGATVTLLDNANGQKLVATTKDNGEYQLSQISPAKYAITVTASGFGSQAKEAELLVNQPATINFVLSLQSNTEVVNVTAAAQTLNITDASLGNSTNNATIQALPSETRNVPDILSLQPGVIYLPAPSNPAMQDSRSGAVNGGRSDQGNITVDGIDDNDQVNGFAFTGVLRQTQDSIEEFRVTTGLANADAGRSSGAQVSLITKSGTNQYHGAVYWYNRPTFTVANDFFYKQAELNSGLPNRPGKLIRNIFGGDVGGPNHQKQTFLLRQLRGQPYRRERPASPHCSHRLLPKWHPPVPGNDREWRNGGTDPHLRSGRDARRRLYSLQHCRIQPKPRAQSERLGLLQVNACCQRIQRRRRPQYGLLLFFISQPQDPQHHDPPS